MHQRALRTVLLIQAIEETDRTGEVIPLADRADASRAVIRDGRWPAAQSGARLTAAADSFLQQRSARLLERLRVRSPVVTHVLALAGGLVWLGRLILVLAFAAGVSLAAIDGSRYINILAFPLIALIAWNLLVYLVLLIFWLRNTGPRPTPRAWPANLYERLIASRLETLLRQSTRYNVPLTHGLRRFAADWTSVSRPLQLLRAKRVMHLAALLLAVGLIVGLYVRGIVFRYEAGWESTFLGPEGVRALLHVLYGPASAVTGIPVGSVDDIRAMRWTGNSGGVGAAPWIHLIAVTAVLYIVLPRLVAVLVTSAVAWRFSHRPPLPPSLLGYARALVMGVGNGTLRETARVIPYAYEPKPACVSGLESLLAAALGTNFTLDVQAPVRYGDEDSASTRFSGAATWNVLLMTLAATPEVENHGALLAQIRDWLTEHASASPLLVVIDETPYTARLRGDPSYDQRLQERRNLWRTFVAGYGLRACLVDLAQMRPGSSSELDARDSVRAALWTASELA